MESSSVQTLQSPCNCCKLKCDFAEVWAVSAQLFIFQTPDSAIARAAVLASIKALASNSSNAWPFQFQQSWHAASATKYSPYLERDIKDLSDGAHVHKNAIGLRLTFAVKATSILSVARNRTARIADQCLQILV